VHMLRLEENAVSGLTFQLTRNPVFSTSSPVLYPTVCVYSENRRRSYTRVAPCMHHTLDRVRTTQTSAGTIPVCRKSGAVRLERFVFARPLRVFSFKASERATCFGGDLTTRSGAEESEMDGGVCPVPTCCRRDRPCASRSAWCRLGVVLRDTLANRVQKLSCLVTVARGRRLGRIWAPDPSFKHHAVIIDCW
jgi:hypothetical protein